jgi:protein-tyrosine-phosphatase
MKAHPNHEHQNPVHQNPTHNDKALQNLPSDRILMLDELAEAIASTDKPKLTFICTHNSRRSHFAQIAAREAAIKEGLDIDTYSGGTEATKLNTNAYNALKAAGINIEKMPEEVETGNNIYLYTDASGIAHKLYSKKFTDANNPQKDFIAVMVCSDADNNCPYVSGASDRISLPFEDPKVSDGTGKEPEVYRNRFNQISEQMEYVIRRAAQLRKTR